MFGKLQRIVAGRLLGILALAPIALIGCPGKAAGREPQDNTPVLGLVPTHVGQVFSLPPSPGAPLTATVEFETTQVLSDRTVVVHKSTSYVARDSKGRTRNELRGEGPNGLPETLQVILYDPETKVRTTLSPRTHTATQAIVKPSSITGELSQASASGAKPNRGGAQKDATSTEVGVDYMNGMDVKHIRERKTVSSVTSENEGQVEAVYEYWYSPELKVNLLSKRDDPRTGQQSARLKDIRRGEPSASLFEIPPDYKVIVAVKSLRANP